MKPLFALCFFSCFAVAQSTKLPSASGCVLEISPDPLTQFDRVFTLTVKSDGKPFSLSAFTASMPDHGHGMTTKPRWKQAAADTVVIEGIKLSMRGKWTFVFDGTCSGKKMSTTWSGRL